VSLFLTIKLDGANLFFEVAPWEGNERVGCRRGGVGGREKPTAWLLGGHPNHSILYRLITQREMGGKGNLTPNWLKNSFQWATIFGGGGK